MEFKLNEAAEERAQNAAKSIREFFGDDCNAEIAILFTTGLDKFFHNWTQRRRDMPFEKICGFENLSELGSVEGHERSLFYSNVGLNHFWGLSGRIHLNENPFNPGPVREMVRLQFDMLAKLGVRVIFLTSVVGSTTPTVMVGQIGVVTNFLSYGNAFTGCSGEFPMIEDALSKRLQEEAFDMAEEFEAVPVTHFFWEGPHIESPKQKDLIYRQGGHVVGMSCQPGADAAARQGMKALALAYVVNGYVHSHQTVLEVVKKKGGRWMEHLENLIRTMPLPEDL